MWGGRGGGEDTARSVRDDPMNPEKEIYLKKALCFQLASCLLQTLTRRPWKCFGFMDGKLSFCPSLFTASDKNTPIKTKHPYSFGKSYNIKHLIHSHAPYVLMGDLLALCPERG